MKVIHDAAPKEVNEQAYVSMEKIHSADVRYYEEQIDHHSSIQAIEQDNRVAHFDQRKMEIHLAFQAQESTLAVVQKFRYSGYWLVMMEEAMNKR